MIIVNKKITIDDVNKIINYIKERNEKITALDVLHCYRKYGIFMPELSKLEKLKDDLEKSMRYVPEFTIDSKGYFLQDGRRILNVQPKNIFRKLLNRILK